MPDHEISRASTTKGLPIAPSLGPALQSEELPKGDTLVDKRVLFISALAIAVAIAAGVIAQCLVLLIGLITNLAFYGRVATEFVSPAGNHLGLLVVIVPVVGGVLFGFCVD